MVVSELMVRTAEELAKYQIAKQAVREQFPLLRTASVVTAAPISK